MNLRYTLLADGSSDRSLIPIIDWVLRQGAEALKIESIVSQWADLGYLYRRLGPLSDRISKAMEAYPCDLLFIHRDAEAESAESRIVEIKTAIASAQLVLAPQCIPIIPIRMTESWLLDSEAAIRSAAGNPSGTVDLGLPRITTLERQSDPKNLLFEKLRLASGLGSRRRERLNVEKARTLVSQRTDDFAHLHGLKSFKDFQERLKAGLNTLTQETGKHGWQDESH